MAEKDCKVVPIEEVIEQLHNELEPFLSENEVKNKKTEKKNNVIQTNVSASLTSNERKRYVEISKILNNEQVKGLERLLKTERKNSMMQITGDTTGKNITKVEEKENDKEEEEEKENEESSWMGKLLSILFIGGAAVTLLYDSISGFFIKGWDWLTEIFTKISTYFDVNNSNSQVGKIVSIISSSLSSLWEFLKSAFTGLSNAGKWIWDGLSSSWNSFIKGDNSIMSFFSKIVNGMLNFGNNIVGWLGNTLYNAIIGPIKSIFGLAEEDGKKAGEEAAKNLSAEVSAEQQKNIQNDAIAKVQAEVAKSRTVALSDKEFIELTQRENEKRIKEVEENAKKQGIQVTNGKLTDESIGRQLAEQLLSAAEQEADSKIDGEDREKMLSKLQEVLKTSDGKLQIQGEELKEKIKELADDASNMVWFDSDVINLLQDLKGEQLNKWTAGLTASASKMLEVQASLDANVAGKELSEEERFVQRMQIAQANNQMAEFNLSEARNMITQSINVIKESFGNYDIKWVDYFKEGMRDVISALSNDLKITLQTEKVSGDDYSTRNYNIMPIKKEEIVEITNKLENIASESLSSINKQNEILGDLLNQIKNMPAGASSNAPLIVPLEGEGQKKEEDSSFSILQGAEILKNSLLAALA